VIFYNPQGVWLEGLTLTNFEEAPKFLKRMEKGLN
jgi:thiol:disulfide interchange protein DsbD